MFLFLNNFPVAPRILPMVPFMAPTTLPLSFFLSDARESVLAYDERAVEARVVTLGLGSMGAAMGMLADDESGSSC